AGNRRADRASPPGTHLQVRSCRRAWAASSIGSSAQENAMTARRRGWFPLLAVLAFAGASALPGPARAAEPAPAPPRDGAHDFDFEIGTWKTQLKRLVHPLTGSDEWAEYEGITTVRKVWDGRA